MLINLSIKNIALVDSLSVDFSGHMSIFTGETGAGKSILLDAFALALGGRGNGRLVRKGCDQGSVSALFDIIPANRIYSDLARLEQIQDNQIILRRIQMSDGRTRAFINDEPVSISKLKIIGAKLVEIHGQHEARAFADPNHYRYLLDCFADLLAPGDDLKQLVAKYRHLQQQRERIIDEIAANEQQRQYLASAVTEINNLNVGDGEEQQLAARRRLMMDSEKIAAHIDEAHDIIAGNASPVAAIRSVSRRLQRQVGGGSQLLEPVLNSLDTLIDNIIATGEEIEEVRQQMEFDPFELEKLEERLFAIRAAVRKYDSPADDLASLAQQSQAKLDNMTATDNRLKHIDNELKTTKEKFADLAADISDKRMRAASQFSERVMMELPSLSLGKAEFRVRIERDENKITGHGYDRVLFEVKTNPGSNYGSLIEIASGGELARFLLAIKVVLAEKGSAPTLVFDEVDTGAGGAVAEAIGKRLARLGDNVQVIAVTHAAQVAVQASHHYVIAKLSLDNQTRTQAKILAVGQRREEIARMIAGQRITDEARAAAGRLLSEAGRTTAKKSA